MSRYVLITAGNTSEPIDSVRSITNTASGKLGSIVADEFCNEGINVVYVCGRNSVKPSQPTARTVTIEGVADLSKAVKELSQEYTFDCIVHSMAVSDYTVKGVLPYDELSEAISHGEQPVFRGKPGKLSSDLANPVILLEKAPKVIREFRNLQPQSILVGFKLLVNAAENELYTAAMKLMKNNGCDFVCANDLNHITQNRHEALLISADGQYTKLSTKQEIANSIVNHVMTKWRDKA